MELTRQFIKKELYDTKLLMQNIPAWVMTLFVLSLVMMNLLANKSINGLPSWLALDAGIVVSWVAFMAMDVLVKRFGPRAANKLTIIAIGLNLLVSGIFFCASIIPGYWGMSFAEEGSIIEAVNIGLDGTFSSTWYVLLGSTTAFGCSALVNNGLNWSIGKLFKQHPDSFGAYAARSYGSTIIAQFIDNIVFALIVSMNFFGWTFLQCVMCALTGAIVELLFEVVFSPFGYKIVNKWKKESIGQDYIDWTISNGGTL